MNDHGKLRIWYPDFAIDGTNVVIEYFGLAGDPDYDRGMMRKLEVYKQNGIKVIPMFVDYFKNTNWRKYLTENIRKYTRRVSEDIGRLVEKLNPYGIPLGLEYRP